MGDLEPIGPHLARLAKLERDVATFECANCSGEFIGAGSERGWCRACEAEAREAEIRRPLQRDAVLRAAHVPDRYRQPFVDPEPWPIDPVRGTSLADWTGDPWSVALVGSDYGAGKSMLAAELLWRVIAARGGGRGSWVRAGSLIAALWGRRGFEAQAKAHELAAVDVLVIDELGRAHRSEAAWEVVSDLAGERYDWCRPTIFTTNLTRGEIEAGEGSLHDRLRDGLLVPIAGESQRGHR